MVLPCETSARQVRRREILLARQSAPHRRFEAVAAGFPANHHTKVPRSDKALAWLRQRRRWPNDGQVLRLRSALPENSGPASRCFCHERARIPGFVWEHWERRPHKTRTSRFPKCLRNLLLAACRRWLAGIWAAGYPPVLK